MKKNLFYCLFTVLCSVLCTTTLFTSCSDDDDEAPKTVNPLVGVYGLSDYETATFTVAESDGPIDNFPMAGPLYAEWKAGEEEFPVAASGVFRMMGAAMLPQVLNTIELKEDGNIVASYIDKPTLQAADQFMPWAVSGLMEQKFPEKSTITSLAVTSGFQTSPDGLATWTESNGKVLVKLNITNVLGTALGGQDASGLGNVSDLEGIINQILTGEPAVLKQLLKAMFQIDLTNVTDASIRQLQGWALNGITLNKKEEGGKTYLYLDRSAFDAFMTSRDTGEIDDWGEDRKSVV